MGSPHQLSVGTCLEVSEGSTYTCLQVVASLIQLQELAVSSGRTAPLHTVATVRHPRTIQLINYITSHAHSNPDSSQSHSMQSSNDSNSPQHGVHSTQANHAGALSMQAKALDNLSQDHFNSQHPQHDQKQHFSHEHNVAGDAQVAPLKSNASSAGRDGKKMQAAQAALSVDVLLPDELLSGLLTQCSVQPELLSVMEDLFDSAGEKE